MIKILTHVSILFILVVAGCSEEIQPDPPTFYKIFTGSKTKKTWQLTSLKWTGVGKSDITYSIGCYSDDRYTFYANADNTYEVSGGTNKCDANEPAVIVSDAWSFVNATSTLSIIMPVFSDNILPFYVPKITAKEMTLVIYLDQESQYSYTITMQSVSEE